MSCGLPKAMCTRPHWPTYFFATTLLVCFPVVSQSSPPLILKKQGSFFVGGDKKAVQEPATEALSAQNGDITINQMYVQYQIPLNGDHHLPIVMVHGCCLSSKTWETTPDGRMGWSEYLVQHERPVYLADQVSRARSGFDPTAFYKVRLGKLTLARMPQIESPTHQFAWRMFRLGPKYGTAFDDEQFPVEAVDEFYKQMIPDLNATISRAANPTWRNLAVLSSQLGGVILVGHSESGFFPERAALIDPLSIKGIVSIETQCENVQLTAAQIAILAKIPAIIIFGDHLSDVILHTKSGNWTWADALESCKSFANQVNERGGDVELLHLPALGIRGNSHMLMQDRNSDQIADLLLAWIDQHVESKATRKFK
jgi:hypothetical protein